jgi:class 3 adenylate cyclase
MRIFSHLSTQTRLFVVFGLLILVATIVALTGVVKAVAFQQQVADLRSSAQAMERAGRAQNDLAREQFAIKNALLSDDPRDWGQVYTYSGQFYDFVDSEYLNTPSDEQLQALDEIDALRSQFDQETGKVYDTLWDDDFDPEQAMLTVKESADPVAEQLDQRLEQMAAFYQGKIDRQAALIEQAVRASATTGVQVTLILAVLLVVAVYVTSHVTQPLNSLTSAIVAFQNNTYKPEMLSPYLKRRDELGQLARAVDEMATSINESNRLKDQFLQSASRFIPMQYLEFLEKPAITEVNLGDHVAAEMAVMFSDIRGFTTASEKMTPRENFDFINEYLKLVSPIIQKHDGFIVKFLGDGMMAIFPYGVDDAVQAGIEKQERVKDFNALLGQRGYPPVTVGIGIHTGQMMVGMIGEERRLQGDAFSDNVNLTSRVEGLNKFYGTSMIISEDTLHGLQQPGSYRMRWLGKALVKGRSTPLGLYEVYEGLPDEVVARRESSKADFERGIELYTRGRFLDARQAFQAALVIDPQDQTARYYLERCMEWAERAAPPSRQRWSSIPRIKRRVITWSAAWNGRSVQRLRIGTA